MAAVEAAATAGTGEMEPIKLKIKEHYDLCSPHYQSLWGRHIHHGIWRTGKETKEEAQDNLVDELLAHAKLPEHPKVLDVGCGVGGTSCRLAAKVGANVTGVTISTTQVAMAKENAEKTGVADRVRFFEMDGEKLDFPGEEGTFDAVWISEALSHFVTKPKFFAGAMRMLKPGGKLVIADWFRADHIGKKLEETVIKPIEFGMLLPRLDSMTDYINYLNSAGFRLLWLEDVSKETARTWDICLDVITNPGLWKLAYTMGLEFVNFLKTFKDMGDGFATGSFRYGLLVSEKPKPEELE